MFPLLGAVVVVAVYDQSTLAAIPPYASNLAAYRSDGAFVARIQRMMPKGAMIYQFPYMTFPENGPVNLMLDYDLGRGYIFSSDLLELRGSEGAATGLGGCRTGIAAADDVGRHRRRWVHGDLD